MSMISIGGVQLPNPSSYSVKRSDLDSDSTTRNAAGVLLRDRVRAGVYSIDATWTLKGSQYKALVDALSAESFTVTFFDPNSGTYQTAAMMYSGDRSGKLVSYIDEAHPENAIWELSVSMVQY